MAAIQTLARSARSGSCKTTEPLKNDPLAPPHDWWFWQLIEVAAVVPIMGRTLQSRFGWRKTFAISFIQDAACVPASDAARTLPSVVSQALGA